MRIEGSA